MNALNVENGVLSLEAIIVGIYVRMTYQIKRRRRNEKTDIEIRSGNRRLEGVIEAHG
jgi:hypothetical protein